MCWVQAHAMTEQALGQGMALQLGLAMHNQAMSMQVCADSYSSVQYNAFVAPHAPKPGQTFFCAVALLRVPLPVLTAMALSPIMHLSLTADSFVLAVACSSFCVYGHDLVAHPIMHLPWTADSLGFAVAIPFSVFLAMTLWP